MLAKRRIFLGSMLGIASAGLLSHTNVLALSPEADSVHIASNQYPWFTFFERQGRNWSADLNVSLKEFAQSGIPGYEPIINNAQEMQALAPLLKKHNLQMRSLYVNSTLHQEQESSLKQVIAIADAAKALGTKIIVTNPSPIRWGGPEDKTDKQLEIQALALNRLGAELGKRGITLAYHTHDAEMRNAAREFHHMMLATDAKNVSLCLDAHWIYRGSGNSQVALFDIVRLYGKRISELHLRQSKAGIWTEVFAEGDIDYKRLVQELVAMRLQPHLVLEQAIEEQSAHTLDAVQAHKKSMDYARNLLSAFTG